MKSYLLDLLVITNKLQKRLLNLVQQLLKKIGFSNISSTELAIIYEMLEMNEFTPKTVAKSGDHMINNLIFHFKKMEKRGLVNIKSISENPNDMNIKIDKEKNKKIIQEFINNSIIIENQLDQTYLNNIHKLSENINSF